MKGDRVRIGATGVYKEAEGSVIAVYMPKVDSERPGYYVHDQHKNVFVDMHGGVKAGSTGTVDGEPVKVLRSQLHGSEMPLGVSGEDSTLLYPVALDAYQRVGWFPAENIKIVSGGI